MKNLIAFLLPVLMFASLLGCEPKEDIITTDPEAVLSFSEDTVIFDTVFTSIGTVTKRLKVYNRNDNAVKISEISLGKGSQSEYRLVINGDETAAARNLELRGNDSIYVLVKAFIDPTSQNTPFIITDSINFLTNNQRQDIKLVAWGQNAYFYNDSVLTCNTVWRADKPHVIYNSVLVDSGCTLTIEPGARVYSHAGSFIYVAGTLKAGVGGNNDNRIYFSGDRLESRFDDVPGQWSGILFLQSSVNNEIRYAEIKNANYGLYVGIPDADSDPDVQVENSVIKNMFIAGVMSFTSDVSLTNTLINNCGQYTFAGLAGGNYDFKYCTFANYSPQFNRREESFVFSDYIKLSDNSEIKEPYAVSLVNSIVWGSRSDGKRDEMLFLNEVFTTNTLFIRNSIVKTEAYATDFASLAGVLINVDPRFKNLSRQDFHLDTLSPANGAAAPIAVTIDLEDKARDSNNPDIGAYERVE